MGRGDRQATIEGSQPEHKRCAYKLNPGAIDESHEDDRIGVIAAKMQLTKLVEADEAVFQKCKGLLSHCTTQIAMSAQTDSFRPKMAL